MEKVSDIIPDVITDPFANLLKKWKKSKSELYSTSRVKSPFFAIRPEELLLICVFGITVGSVVFTVLVLTNALNRNDMARNLKYDSIEYAHQRVLDKIQRAVPNVIVDEFGVPLGGKKAAIQFAHDLRNKILEEENNEMEDEEILNRLTMKVAIDAMKILDDRKIQQADKATQRQILLEKLGRSGHFGTTMLVKPLDLNEEVDGDEAKDDNGKADPEKEEKQPQEPTRHKRDLGEMSMKENPFRIEKMSIVKREADDAFRFVKSEDDPFKRIVSSEDDPFRFQ